MTFRSLIYYQGLKLTSIDKYHLMWYFIISCNSAGEHNPGGPMSESEKKKKVPEVQSGDGSHDYTPEEMEKLREAVRKYPEVALRILRRIEKALEE